MDRKHYGVVDGLRMFASFGIVMMHMASNNSYKINGFIYNKIIPSFTDFVFLFMTVSAFGMCCGYYEKVMKNQIDFSDFYEKRFKKILPFFGLLVLADVIISPSVSSLYEAFADLTLLFGFLPDAGGISVIGVGWFLGLIFVFYLVFPFFCVLLKNKKRAWISFGISVFYNFLCNNYFGVNRTNILYCACFFLAGGLVYLYKKDIEKINRWIVMALSIVLIVVYYIVGSNTLTCLILSAVLMIYAVAASENSSLHYDVQNKWKYQSLLQNSVTEFFSRISMEIYLSHMVIFRVFEKLGINKMFGNGILQYVFTVAIVILGASIFAVAMQKIIAVMEQWIQKKA